MIHTKEEHDKAWLEAALSDSLKLLRDHAHCEKKAVGTAMSLIARFPERSELVTAMSELAEEELGHFQEVHQKLLDRGTVLGLDPGDPYAQRLRKLARKGLPEQLVDLLLISALIEARSCERFNLLAEHHPDPELADMFGRFADAEAGHGRLFYELAKGIDALDTPPRYAELKKIEQKILLELPIRCAIH
jgi:tRNA-(ms[2]io[6]A)-hydroxylase